MSAFPVESCERTARGWRVVVRVPSDSPFFEGHFRGAPVLPAVAQLALVRSLAARCLERPVAVRGVEGVRFRGAVLPGNELSVDLAPAGERLGFSISRGGDRITSGRLSIDTASDG